MGWGGKRCVGMECDRKGRRKIPDPLSFSKDVATFEVRLI